MLDDTVFWPDENYYFKEEYLTYRRLRTKENIWKGYVDTKDKLKTIIPYTNYSCIMTGANNNFTTMTFTAEDDWPTVIQFPEQIAYLPTNSLYLVETDLDYFQQFFIKGIAPNLEIFARELRYPRVKSGEMAYYDTFENVYYNSNDLLELENQDKNIRDATVLVGEELGKQFVFPLSQCNILPQTNNACYSACFYDRNVAEVYAKSVSEYIQGIFDRYIDSKRQFDGLRRS